MDTTGSLFSQTLQDITNTKLDELAKKRERFESKRATLLNEKEEDDDSPISTLAKLANGVKSCFQLSLSDGHVVRGSSNNPRLEIDLRNLDRFLQQARYDPSISSKVMEQWRQSLLRHVDIQSLKFSYAALYGQLTTEWLQSKQVPQDIQMEDFELVSSSKRLESRSKWEETVFKDAQVDESAIVQLIEDIFDISSPGLKMLPKALDDLRISISSFQYTLASPGNFSASTLKWTIDSLTTSDLLTDEKRAVLKDFANNPVIINEIADVLNMRMTALSSWSWGDEVRLEERRQLNGSYHIYMHEDLLQAIFLQYVGIKWSVFWKRALNTFRRTAWKSPQVSSPNCHQHQDYALGMSHNGLSVRNIKEKLYHRYCFVSRLMSTEIQQVQTAQGEEEAQAEICTASMVQQAPSSHQPPQSSRRTLQAFSSQKNAIRREEELLSEPMSPMEAKQKILHILSTEIMAKTRLQGDFSCFRSQFDNLYPSLPHATILCVLKFFGVGHEWLDFFLRFLQAPLRFTDDSSPPRHRKRGTPGSHVLSEVFAEVTLFILDFKVNRETDGGILWRSHDDIWFWSSEYDQCVKTWRSIESFANIMGLSLNEARTGSARMTPDDTSLTEKHLPLGQVRWGMLLLNPETHQFEIDQKMVHKHIHELSRQLQDNSGSVFAWIQAWNTYATTFFTSNFGKPANCFGRQHVDQVLSTLERIQRDIFSTSAGSTSAGSGVDSKRSGSVVAYLKHTIEQRFHVENIPDGYFYLPVELGGLEVQNPFVGLLQIRDSVPAHPENLLDKFLKTELEQYNFTKEQFKYRQAAPNNKQTSMTSENTFMPFEEYILYRDEMHTLGQVYSQLLDHPSDENLDFDPNGQVKIALNSLGNQSNLRGILSNFYSMEPYWKWVAQLYGPEIIDHFGGFNIVDAGLLPIGMVSLFRSGRVKWRD
ncbi:hypothetical protein FH972_021638 [Carpinus fangiana]|uniref:Reverse transcriptase domain-containing protein n=1 Tax=Carpinus fangiana TaxID=176857 RepID=A0A5N6KQG5_9ROSI|nr:hypothetical protein FH972_021638 [Carpinus fangiana]